MAIYGLNFVFEMQSQEYLAEKTRIFPCRIFLSRIVDKMFIVNFIPWNFTCHGKFVVARLQRYMQTNTIKVKIPHNRPINYILKS